MGEVSVNALGLPDSNHLETTSFFTLGTVLAVRKCSQNCVQASVELGPEDVSLLERCPHFRGWYVQLGFNGVGT